MEYFKSLESFNKCNNNLIIEAKNIQNKEIAIQQVFPFLLIEDKFLEQVEI